MRTSLAAAFLVAAPFLLPSPPARAADTGSGATTSDSLVLSIDGTAVARVASWRAPVATADISTAKTGDNGQTDSYTGAKATATLHLPPVVPGALLIAYSQPKPQHDITLVRVDAGGHAIARYDFQAAVITRIVLPGIDADHSTLETEVEISAGQVQCSKASGEAVVIPHPPAVARMRVTAGTLDFSRATSIGPLLLKTEVTWDELGEHREEVAVPTTTSVGALRVTFDPRHAPDLDAWSNLYWTHPPMIAEGELDYLDSSNKVVASMKLRGLLLREIAQGSAASTVDLAMDRADFGGSQGASSAPAPSGRVFGTSYPTDAGTITVDSAEYSVSRVPVANDDPMTPQAEEKLFVVHLRLKNGGADPLPFDPDSLVAHVLDASGNRVDNTGELLDAAGTPYTGGKKISSGTEIPVVMVLKMAAKPAAKSLEIHGVSDADLGLTYDLTDPKNAPKKLVAPFVEASDASGASAPATVLARPSVAYPMGAWDVTFVGMKKLGSCADYDRGCWLASFQIANRALKTETFDSSSLDLRLSDGSETVEPSGIYPASGTGDRVAADVVASGHLAVSAPFPATIAPNELRVRVPGGRDFVLKKPAAGS